MSLPVKFIGPDSRTWRDSLLETLKLFADVQASHQDAGPLPSDESAQIIFIDDRLSGLTEWLAQVNRQGKVLILVSREGEKVPEALTKQQVDDVLVQPFRTVEVLGKLRQLQLLLRWDEVEKLNQTFSQSINQLRDDLELAQRIQKARLPRRFEDLKGFSVRSRYLSGLRPGGDYFDLIEADANAHGSSDRFMVLMTDSSSYGLSSAVLSILMKVAVRLSGQEMKDLPGMIKRIQNEILLTLNDVDHLSVLMAVISKKDLSMRYLRIGSATLWRGPIGRDFIELPAQSGAISKKDRVREIQEGEVKLEPGDRLVFVSDGFIKGAGGEDAIAANLKKLRSREALDLLNEMAYHARKSGSDPEFPPEDCTGIVIDIDPKLMRLA